MSIASVDDLPLQGKNVLVRVDFNVPLDAAGNITDLTRIKASLPTLELILKKKGKIILLSHLGRPKGEKNLKYTLRPCARALSALLQKEVSFIPDCLQLHTRENQEEILLLENLRFYPAEENPKLDPTFTKTLASYGDFYVNDAFAASHRNHASIVDLAHCFSGRAAEGLLLEKERKNLTILVTNPPHPFHLIVGGAKVSSKLGVLHSLLPKTSALYIGGGMAFTFLKAAGYSIGNSLYEPNVLEEAKKVLSFCKQNTIPLFLPEDLVITQEITPTSPFKTQSSQGGIETGWQGVDIGPKTIKTWKNSLQTAASIFWNGPLGVFEIPNFAKGTLEMAQFLSKLPSLRIIGGGDSCAAIQALNISNNFSHISTGGGASLEFLEKGSLPGIEALK